MGTTNHSTRHAMRHPISRPVAKPITGESSGGGSAPLANLPLEGLSPSIAISTQYLGGDGNGQAWADARYPTVRVEKGYGSGVFQDLYPDPTTGELFTAPDGGGVSATAFADGSRLLVEIPYNQSLAGPLASGHPSAISADRRVLLDVSVTTSPAFAGIAQGTQDPSQHATERGYDTNVSVVSNAGFNVFVLDNGANSTNYVSFRNNGGSSQNLLVDAGGNQRWYDAAVSFVNFISSTSLPNARGWFVDRVLATPTTDVRIAVDGGYRQGSGVNTVNSTSTPIRIWGATSPLTGRAFAFVISSGEMVGSLAKQVCSRMHFACRSIFGAAQLSLMGPKVFQGFPIDLTTNTGEIFIECASGPGRAIEASFNGSAYQTIGTTDDNGYLSGSMTSVAPGRGTLNVRVVGQTTTVSVSNISVGVFVATFGQSNSLGRGDDYTFSPIVGCRQGSGDWLPLPATDKSWVAKFAIDLATAESAPCVYHNIGAGATYLYFNAAGSTDGRHGHWAYNNPGSSVPNNFSTLLVRNAELWYGEPNFTIFHQGESEGVDGVSAADYETSLVNMWTEFQEQTGHSGKLWIMQIGRNGTAIDSRVDAIRQAQVNAVANHPDLFELGGCLAHLTVEDTLDSGQNVHFFTTSQKNAVAAVFRRHALGAGRGPRFSSMVASGTTITITCTGGVSPLTISGGEAVSPIGWTVTDGGGSKTVTAVSVSGLVITLTVNSSLTGSVNVKWLSHYSGVGTTLLDSDATTPVPPEPFSQTVAAT